MYKRQVEGEGLTDGLLILSTADSAAPGQRITPVTDSGEETSSSGELMDMMMGAAQCCLLYTSQSRRSTG